MTNDYLYTVKWPIQKGVVQGKSGVTPLSFWLHLAADQTFQMRYIMSPNYWWIQTFRPSKFQVRKKVCLSKDPLLRQTFFCILKLDGLQVWKHLEFGDIMYLI